MNKQKLIFGGLGALGVLAFLSIAVVSMLGQESFSVLNSFAGELGKYPAGYLVSSPALLFNIALIASGLLMCVFFIGYGFQKGSVLFTAASFFGILTGVLIMGQGIFTLNFAGTHYVFTVMLFAAAFFTAAFYITASIVTREIDLAGIIVAFVCGAASAVFALFVQLGDLPVLLSVPFETRAQLLPFAVIEWAAIVLIFAFVALLSAKMIIDSFKGDSIDIDKKPKIKAKGLKYKQSTHDLEI